MHKEGTNLRGGAAFYIIMAYLNSADAAQHATELRGAKAALDNHPDRPLFDQTVTSPLHFGSVMALHYPTDTHFPVAEAMATFFHWTLPGGIVFGFDLQLRDAPGALLCGSTGGITVKFPTATPQPIVDAHARTLEGCHTMLQRK